MASCRGADLVVLQRVASKLQKCRRKKWANLRKSQDKMFGLLKQRAKGKGVGAFAAESFKARVLCVSSDRYALHLGDSVPRLPVPQRDLVYRIYGYTASTQGRGAKHARWCAEYRGGAVSRLAAATTYRNKLTDKKLQSVMTCGSFSRLQVLSDVAEAFGVGMVQLPRSFGPGVRFDAAPLKLKEIAEVRDRLNQSGAACRPRSFFWARGSLRL